MTDRYVNPAVGSSGTGGSWAQAYKTLKEATDAAAAGEPIYFATGTADVITADTNYLLAAGVRVISTSDTVNEPPTTYAAGATISTVTDNVDLVIYGVGAIYGLTISLGTGTQVSTIRLTNGNNNHIVAVDCAFTFGGTNSTSAFFAGATADYLQVVECINCTFTWAATGQGIGAYSSLTKFIDCDMSAGSTHPSVLFEVMNRGSTIEMIGCDLSDITTVLEAAPVGAARHTFSQCKLKASATIFAPSGAGSGEAFVFDCSSGDSHIDLAHYTYLGSTVITGTYYADDHIGDSAFSWLVDGSNATKANPYYSPWISAYHTGTSGITPYLEALRVDSTTMYHEDEVWVEMTAKVTSGSTRADFYTNRSDPLTLNVDNATSDKTYADWTGTPTDTDSGDSTLKLALNAAITPAEAGYISARIGVSGNYTVYVDPQIRGLS